MKQNQEDLDLKELQESESFMELRKLKVKRLLNHHVLLSKNTLFEEHLKAKRILMLLDIKHPKFKG